MLVAFTMKAKPGKEKEFEAHLNDPEAARFVAERIGATRNTLFMGNGRMFRVFEFPEGVRPRPLAEVAAEEPRVADFLRRLSELVEGGFDVDDAQSFAAFTARAAMPVVFDVRV